MEHQVFNAWRPFGKFRDLVIDAFSVELFDDRSLKFIVDTFDVYDHAGHRIHRTLDRNV
jgi:hypothetical protein